MINYSAEEEDNDIEDNNIKDDAENNNTEEEEENNNINQGEDRLQDPRVWTHCVGILYFSKD